MLRFRDLGPLEVTRDGAPVPIGGARLVSALALLLTRRGEHVPAHAVAEAMGGMPSTVDAHIRRLGHALEPGDPFAVIQRTGGGFRLVVDPDAVDSVRAERLAGEAADLLVDGRPDAAVRCADQALALWRGRPYGALADAPWATATVARLTEIGDHLRERLIEALVSAGDVQRALVELEDALAEAPLREALWVLRMRAHARAGHADEALGAYREAQRSLDAEPGPELRAERARILAGGPTPDPLPEVRPTRPAVRLTRPEPGPALVGRAAERAAVRDRLRGVQDGRPLVVWVEGDAGSGKSALVDALVGELPPEFGVLRAEADELAVDEPLALAVQLGALDSGAACPAGLEVLRCWSALQEEGPLAIVVEDLHWADPDSRLALLTAVRRLAGDRVVVLVTSRPGAADGWTRFNLDARRCLRIDVGALTVAEVGELGAVHGVELGGRAAARLHAHTVGHALYVRTLLTELTPAQLTRREGALPAPRSLASTTLAALSALPGPARELALALAVVTRPVPLPVAARIAQVDPEAADALVASGLARIRTVEAGEELVLAHPLYRVAVWDDLPPSRRRALHRAAAAQLGTREALTHRVAAAEGPDPELAADLEAAATGLGRVPAARALLAASRVAEGGRAEQLLLAAVALLVAAGRQRQAADHRLEVEACAEGSRRDLVLGLLDWEAGDAGAAEAGFRRAAESGGPVDVVAAATVRLAVLQYTGGRGGEAIASATRALASPGLTPAGEREAWIALAVGEQMRSGAVAGLARLAPRLPAEVTDPADTDLLVARGTLEFYAARPARAVADLTAAIRLARAAPTLAGGWLPRAHLQLAHSLVLTGDWSAAAVHARLASGLVDEEDLIWVRAQTEGIRARLAGCVDGDWAAAEAHLVVAGEAVGRLGSLEAAFSTLIARALVADAREDPREVLAVFAGLVANAMPVPMSTALTWWPMVVDAALDVGEPDAAADLLERLQVAAAERAIDLDAIITGLAARVAEARGDVSGALAGYERAIAALGPDVVLLDRGKLLHRHGRLLLARGDRDTARERLEAALATFAGAAPYAARVRRDLERLGATTPVAPVPRGVSELTGREREVVAMVVRGMTNREVAAELYVTDKAVEYHLGNVYAKLGIRSRRRLRELVNS